MATFVSDLVSRICPVLRRARHLSALVLVAASSSCAAPIVAPEETGSMGAHLRDSGCGSNCGTNTPWLGANLWFYELDQTGIDVNNLGLKIDHFEDRFGEPLTLNVAGYTLQGIKADGTKLEGLELQYAKIWLVAPNGVTPALPPSIYPPPQGEPVVSKDTGKTPAPPDKYRIEIRNVDWVPFDVGNPEDRVPRYDFWAGGASDHELKQLCQPQASPGGNLAGKVIVFRGDRYEVRARLVRPVSPSDPWVNFTCEREGRYKLHLARHTTAGSDSTHNTGRKERQAMLKMYAADYCGGGMTFTAPGQPLEYTDVNRWLGTLPVGDHAPAPSPWDRSKLDSFEAIWDANGARCLNTARLELNDRDPAVTAAIWTSIANECARRGRVTPPLCDDNAIRLEGIAGAPGNVISANPRTKSSP